MVFRRSHRAANDKTLSREYDGTEKREIAVFARRTARVMCKKAATVFLRQLVSQAIKPVPLLRDGDGQPMLPGSDNVGIFEKFRRSFLNGIWRERRRPVPLGTIAPVVKGKEKE